MNQSESQKLKAIIVDDEELARQGLSMRIEQYEDLEIVAECRNGKEAIAAIIEYEPDVVFLDIQMPKLDGFDVLELLGDQAPCVVFVTAYDEYAVQAFEANALDYLLKPLDPERLNKAMEKIRERIGSESSPQYTELLVGRERENELLQRILVRDGSDVHVLAVNSVCYIESADDYVAIHTEDATHIKLDRLGKLQDKLDPRQFCRIHRLCLLNINFLSRIETETKDSKIAILESGKELPISRSGYADLKKLL